MTCCPLPIGRHTRKDILVHSAIPTAQEAPLLGSAMKIVSTLLLLLIALAARADALPSALPLEKIRLPAGFAIELWARVDNAREMTLGRHSADGGTVFVGSMQAGKVYAVPYDANMLTAKVVTIADG